MIPGRKLLPYVPRLQFPVQIFEEDGPKKVKDASREELDYLIYHGLVVGFGSKTRIKTLRACRQLLSLDVIRSKKWKVLSMASKTSVKEALVYASPVWKHHWIRCTSWPHTGGHK